MSLGQQLPIGPKVVPLLGLPCRILNMSPKKELPWGLWGLRLLTLTLVAFILSGLRFRV